MNAAPFGVPSPVTLSQPGPVVSDESVPNVNTSQRVEVLLWNNALTNNFVFSKGCAKAAALSNVVFGGLIISPVTFSRVSIGLTLTSVIALSGSS